jgi:hypothetical protein
LMVRVFGHGGTYGVILTSRVLVSLCQRGLELKLHANKLPGLDLNLCLL